MLGVVAATAADGAVGTTATTAARVGAGVSAGGAAAGVPGAATERSPVGATAGDDDA